MRTRTRSNHRGFTLIELMVVITIIAALVALSASAVLKFIQVQQTTNTQSTLDRVQSQLAKAWSKVKDQAFKEAPSLAAGLAGTDPNAANRAKMIYVKLKMRQAFPMNFAEALNVPYNNPELAAWGLPTLVPASPLPALPGYYSYLTSLGITPLMVSAQPFPDPRESSACLLMALQRGVSGAGINPADLTAGGAAGSMITPSGGNLPYLNDAWGRPILFSRAPAGSFYLNPAGPVAGNNDPGDPQGYLLTPAWRYINPPTLAPPYTLSFTQYTQLMLEYPPPGNMSFKLAPMLASGGQTNWTKTWPPPAWPPSPPPPPVPYPLSLILDSVTFASVPGQDALFSTP